MQETQIQSLVPEVARDTGEQLNPGATTIEPVLWSLGAATTEPACHNFWSPSALELRSKRSHRDEKPARHNSRVAPAHCN